MQLTVRDVSQFLNSSEATVINWIKRRGLPAHRVNGQYRLSRAELLEWATANRIKVAVDLFDQPDTPDERVATLADALEAGGIVRNLRDTSKEQALRALVEVLPLPDGNDRDLLLRLFLARESSASTAIGDGIALPHVRNPIVLHVDRPMVTLCFLEKPVDFGALDGQLVQVLFSLICPTMRDHLQMLARLSHALHDPGFKQAVLGKEPNEKILQDARRVDAGIDLKCGAAGRTTQ